MKRLLILVLASLAPISASAVRQDDAAEATLEAASGDRSLRVRLGSNGSARIVDIPIELYVSRVLAAEGEPRAAVAAQQALAIAIRTFAAANAGRHRREGFDLCDTTHCQVIRPSTPITRRAALNTAGQLLMYDGRPADVFYSASCGGRSEAASDVWRGALDHPYLRSAVDDVHESETPWLIDVPLARVEQALRRLGFGGRRLKAVEVERRSDSGRVTRLHLSGMQPEQISGDDFRAAIGHRELKSTQFSVHRDGGTLRFTGRGYGHGVGMCVVGAGLRAARGETARQILDQYFPGLELQSPPALAAAAAPAIEAAPEHEAVGSLSPVHQLLARIRGELAATLGIQPAPVLQLQVHESLDSFRQATGRPWWVSAAVTGTTIELPPPVALAQRDGFEAALRRGVAEALVATALPERPAWIRAGAALYYAKTPTAHPPTKRPCPSDAELTMAVSATAQRDADLRAEACFARAVAKAERWRDVRN